MPELPASALSPWPLTRHETVSTHPVFAVRRTEYGPRGAFFTLECPDWCNVVAVTPDQHVVLVRQFRFGTNTVTLEIPGGMIAPGEDPLVAVQRELDEESGYRASKVEPLSSLCPNPALQGNRLHAFVAWDAIPSRAGALHGMAAELEETELLLWPRARLGELLDSGAVDHSLCAGVLETFLRKFGSVEKS